VTEKLEPLSQGPAGRRAAAVLVSRVPALDRGEADRSAFGEVMAATGGGQDFGGLEQSGPHTGPEASAAPPTGVWKISAALGSSSVSQLPTGTSIVRDSVLVAQAIATADGLSARASADLDAVAGREVGDVVTADVAVPLSDGTGSVTPSILALTEAALLASGGLLADTAPKPKLLPPSQPGTTSGFKAPISVGVATASLVDPLSAGSPTVTVVAHERHLGSAASPQSYEQLAADVVPIESGPAVVEPEAAVEPKVIERPATASKTAKVPVQPDLARPVLGQRGGAMLSAGRAEAVVKDRSPKEWPISPAPVQTVQIGPPVSVPVGMVAAQVAAAIDQQSGPAWTGLATYAPPEGSLAPQRLPGAVRVLVVELQPAELGTVTVRLSLKGDTLSVALSAEERGTTALLDTQRGMLVDELRTLGHKIGDISVTLATTAEATTSGSIAGRETGTTSAQGGSDNGGGGRSAGQGQGSQRPPVRAQFSDAEGPEQDSWASPGLPRAGLYL
jgi:Flagellar hook-length control protein FliK